MMKCVTTEVKCPAEDYRRRSRSAPAVGGKGRRECGGKFFFVVVIYSLSPLSGFLRSRERSGCWYLFNLLLLKWREVAKSDSCSNVGSVVSHCRRRRDPLCECARDKRAHFITLWSPSFLFVGSVCRLGVSCFPPLFPLPTFLSCHCVGASDGHAEKLGSKVSRTRELSERSIGPLG